MELDQLTPQTAADAVEALWSRYDALLADLSTDDWSRPTPCAGWDVADVVGHVGGLTLMFAGEEEPDPPEGWTVPPGLGPIDTFTETGVAARRHRSPEAHLAELAHARRVWVEALRDLPDLEGQTVGPTGRMTQRQFVAVRLFDLWHHLWDLHRALAVPMDLGDDSVAAQQCHAYVLRLVPWLFGKRAGAPEGARVRLRLGVPLHAERAVVVRDGRAGWDEAQPDDDAVTGPAGAFSLVVTGRLDAEQAAAEGLAAEGVQAERLLGARMFG